MKKIIVFLFLFLFLTGCVFNPTTGFSNGTVIKYVVITQLVTQAEASSALCLIPGTGATGTPQAVAMIETPTPLSTATLDQSPYPTDPLWTDTSMPTSTISATPYQSPYPTLAWWTATSTRAHIITPVKIRRKYHRL